MTAVMTLGDLGCYSGSGRVRRAASPTPHTEEPTMGLHTETTKQEASRYDSSGNMQSCIDACRSCHEICIRTIEHCLQMGGEDARADHIRLLTDCSQICQTSADFMLRSSPLHSLTCSACAKVCERCAAECGKFSGDEAMAACAEACRECAESCSRMASA